MANHELETDRWVATKLGRLGYGGEWKPNAGRAFAQLAAKNRDGSRAQPPAARRWIWTTLAAAFAYSALLLLPASRACAEQPGACVLRALGVAGQTNAANPGR